MKIERFGSLPTTEYVISAGWPGQTVWDPFAYGEHFRFECIVTTLTIPPQTAFDPEVLVGKIPAAYKVRRQTEFDGEDSVALITSTPLNVLSLSKTPINAWIPTKNAVLTVSRSRSVLLGEPEELRITEEYLPWSRDVLRDLEPSAEGLQSREFPLGDFLGSDVIFWTADPKAKVGTSKGYLFEAPAEEKGQRITAILIRKAPWSTRLACVPVDQEWLNEYLRHAGRIGGGSIFRPLDDGGRVQVTVDASGSQEKEFAEAYAIMKDKTVVWVNDIHGFLRGNDRPRLEHFNEAFRYPPIPAQDGVNIFGPISSVHLGSALGKLMVGNRLFDAAVGSEVDLTGINGFNVEGELISVPIRTERTDVQFSVRSARRVLFNGVVVNSVRELLGISNFVELLLVIATLVQAVLALLAFLHVRSQTRVRDE